MPERRSHTIPDALGPFHNLIAAMPDGVVVVNLDGTIAMVNRNAEALFGYRGAEMLGQPLEMLLPERFQDIHVLHRNAYAAAPRTRVMGSGFQLFGRRKDGSEFPADICLSSFAAPEATAVVAIVRDITDLRVSEAARRESELLSKAVISTLPSHIAVLDDDGVIVAVNEAYQRFALENDADEATMRGVGVNYLSAIRIHFNGDDGTALAAREGILAVLRGSVPAFELEYPCNSPTKRRWFFMQVRPMQGEVGGAVIAHTDITARKQAEEVLRNLNAELERRVEERSEALRASETRYSTLFHSTDEGFCIIEMIFDRDGKPVDYRFLEINPAFERQTGLANAAGKRMRELAPDHEEHWFETYGRVATEGKPIRFQNHAEQLNRHYDVYACRIGEPSDRQVAIVFNDITEKRLMESTLRDAKEVAEQANLAKSEFLSRMSHELRTPLNAVIGYAQLLHLQYPDPGIQEAADAISRGGKHLLNLINEILDLSRIEVGNLAISVEPVAFDTVLQQALSLVQPIADGAGIAIHVDGDVCEGAHVEADGQRMLQVLINLLSNAIKYNRPGGSVTIRCEETPAGKVRIEISDTGRGISKADQELLFQPFQRFGDRGIEGTGLGLALSDRFVAMMGGKLGLAESSAAGSTFYVELKSIVPAFKQVAAPVSSLGGRSLAGRKGTVLYIEDNLSNLRLIETIFSNWKKLTLIPAMQGTVGLELAQTHSPDLILLDLHLPDIMGSKVLERLKLDPATESIPVVILSADATPKQIAALLAGGAVDYLTKPLDIMRFFEVLEEHLPQDD